MAKNVSRSQTSDAHSSNRILLGTTVQGEIRSPGDFRIDGEVSGNIELEGKLVVGEQAVIDGDVQCSQATVSGTIKGKITVSELLLLQSTAKVEGDIVTARLAVEPGAEFTGSCSMGVVRDMNTDAKEAKTSKSRRSAG
jgi:cytoskeletal protein CcmA (bactofilin family)